MFQRQSFTPEAARAGVTQDQVDAANGRIDQAEQTAVRAELNRIPALRAQAADMLAVLMPGSASAAIQSALDALDAAPTASRQVLAARHLDAMMQQWAQAAMIDRDLQRSSAPAVAAEAHRQAAEQARRPVVLSVEQRLARIEQRLGL